MYNKSDISQLSDRYNYVRSNMEKVVRLVSVLKELNRQPIFAEYLALKGGTAINLLVTPLPRLSVDIDLDFTYNCEKTEMMKHRREITQRLQAYMFSQGYRLSPDKGVSFPQNDSVQWGWRGFFSNTEFFGFYG